MLNSGTEPLLNVVEERPFLKVRDIMDMDRSPRSRVFLGAPPKSSLLPDEHFDQGLTIP